MFEELLPTLDEIKKIVDTEYAKIESEILKIKKKEQAERDQKRITEIRENLSDS